MSAPRTVGVLGGGRMGAGIAHAFLLAGAIAKVAPFDWMVPAVCLVLLQLVASLAILRALHVILGWRPLLLIPLTFALFSPLSLPAFAWWAAALNALPMTAAMAWVWSSALTPAVVSSSGPPSWPVTVWHSRASGVPTRSSRPRARTRAGPCAAPSGSTRAYFTDDEPALTTSTLTGRPPRRGPRAGGPRPARPRAPGPASGPAPR